MSEYIKVEILEDVTNKIYVKKCYYLQNYPLVREDRLTTEIKIVIGNLTKCNEEKSLNDILHKDAYLLLYLFDIPPRILVGKIGLIGNIKQEFLKFLLTLRLL